MTAPTTPPPAPDVVTDLLAEPAVQKIEQYVTSALTIAAFVAGGLHPGFKLPPVTSATTGAVAIVAFAAINGWAWLQNRLHRRTRAAMVVSRTTGHADPSSF